MRRQDRKYAMKASVLLYSDLTGPPPTFFAFSGSPTPAAQGGDPGMFKGPGVDAATANAAPGRRVRHLVGPVILPPTTLVIAVAALLVSLARGGTFIG